MERERWKTVELSLLLLEQIGAMVIMVLAGLIVAKAGLLDDQGSQVLARVAIYVLTPCALVDGFQTPLEQDKLEGLLASLLAALVIFGLLLGGSWLLRRGKHPLTPGERPSIVYSNSGNLIIPIIMHTLGGEYVIYSCAYLLVQTLSTWTHGQLLLGGSQGLSVRRVATNPSVCGIFLGLVLFLLGVTLPGPVGSAASSLGAALGPVSMLVIGVMLYQTDLRRAFSNPAIYRTIALRLLVFPLLAMGVLLAIGCLWRPLGDVGEILTVTLLCASGPSATTPTQMAQLYHHPESGYMSSINAVTTVLCVVTMPAMIFLYQFLRGA